MSNVAEAGWLCPIALLHLILALFGGSSRRTPEEEYRWSWSSSTIGYHCPQALVSLVHVWYPFLYSEIELFHLNIYIYISIVFKLFIKQD